ncbi:MAG TPA: tyrosine-protein phosphatase [Candidatus Saccharimonadales bacterium]|nr:tyrosine-protein phosphatase [Candidatus Saccharimonadales bacterium]
MLSQQSDALAVDGLVNLRDLGGLATASGVTTRAGRLLRSESPHTLSESGLRELLDLGIGAVVDLRTTSEREQRPSPLAEAGVHTLHAPIFTDDDDYPDHLATAAEVYCWWLRERRNGVAAAMKAVADAPSGPILVHCHAGKDRTGVVVALVLRLAGVSVDDIADDYAISGVQLAEMLARDRVTAVERGMDAVRVERLFTVRREAMAQTMDCVDTEYGGVVSLLRGIGLDDARIARLTNLLLSPTWP